MIRYQGILVRANVTPTLWSTKESSSPVPNSTSSSLGMKENSIIVDDDDPTFCLCCFQTSHLAKNCLWYEVNIVNSLLLDTNRKTVATVSVELNPEVN